MVDKQNAHRAGGCNHIIDDRFTPTELNKQNPEEGGAYTFQGTQVKELKTTKRGITTTVEPKHSAVRAKTTSTLTEETCGALKKTCFSEEHILKCAQPTMIANELRRRITEVSVREESSIKQMEAYAAQDLKELFESVSGASDKLAKWAVQTIKELVTSAVLHTTQIHN